MADNKDMEVTCPACGKEMVKVHMPVKDFFIDVCIDGCGGIYLDNREYKNIDEQAEDITPLLELFEGKTFKSVDESEKRICAVCGNTMVKNFTSSNHSIQIDECYTCGGKFLDYSEIEKIRAEFATEADRADATIKEMEDKYGAEIAAMNAKHRKAMNESNNTTRMIFYFSDIIEKYL